MRFNIAAIYVTTQCTTQLLPKIKPYCRYLVIQSKLEILYGTVIIVIVVTGCVVFVVVTVTVRTR